MGSRKKSQAPSDTDVAMEKLGAYIRERGLRSTSQRDQICQRFFATQGHPSVDELAALVRQDDPRIGYATVYRTLRLLVDAGLAHERNFGDGLTRYEFQLGDEHHDHIICLDCGAIVEFENDRIEQLQEKQAKTLKFELASHKLELYCHCLQGAGCPRRKSASKGRVA